MAEPTEQDHLPIEKQTLLYRLRKRVWIRRHAEGRKSVEEGKPDRIADLFEEAADALDVLEGVVKAVDAMNSHCHDTCDKLLLKDEACSCGAEAVQYNMGLLDAHRIIKGV